MTAGLSDWTFQWWRKTIKRLFKNKLVLLHRESLQQKLYQASVSSRYAPGSTGLGHGRGITPVPRWCTVLASQGLSLYRKTCPIMQPSTAARCCHSWRVSSVRSHQQELCTASGEGAASPCVGMGPAGTFLHPSFPVLFPEVMNNKKESSFYRKLHKGATQVLWFCLCIPKYTTFFLILYDLQLPYKNKLSAGEWGQAENLFITQPL